MARITYGNALGGQQFFGFEYSASDLDGFEITVARGGRAILVDETTQDKIVLTGKNFEYANDHTTITACDISSLAFRNENNQTYATFDNVTWDIDKLSQLTDSLTDIYDFLAVAFSGKDTIIGSRRADLLNGSTGSDRIFAGGGSDTVDGDAGRDVLTGGKGSDTFFFHEGYGKDVITDFDARGGGVKQDYLEFGDIAFEMNVKGHDLILDFGNGDELTLKNVRERDFDVSDHPMGG